MINLRLFYSAIMIVISLCTITVEAKEENKTLVLKNGDLKVNVVVHRPESSVKGDVLYFHGYGDNVTNHSKLFSEWMKSGFRVISFDFPSHGKTSGGYWQDLNWLTFNDLGNIALAVEKATYEENNRPLMLAGWSTGGLLAIRMIQTKQADQFTRKVNALVLYAPGVAVRKCVGSWYCHITNETLTHDSSFSERSISPITPLERLAFATQLLLEAAKTWTSSLDNNIPTLLFTASSKDDRYVLTEKVKTWAKIQSEENVNMVNIQCPKSLHEMDNELDEYGGLTVRKTSAEFFEKSVFNEKFIFKAPNQICNLF